jgi:hypothetical protein
MNRLHAMLEGFLESDEFLLPLDEKTGSRILWVLTIGGLVALASNRPDRGYFVIQIAKFCDQRGLKCYSDIKTVLGKVLWSNDLEAETMSLWSEVLKN